MTKVSEAYPSNLLKAADLKGRTIKATIQKVAFEEIGQNKDRKPVIYFDGAEKGLVLNKTNATEIAAAHGDEMDEWAGKEIELFSQMVPYQGQNVAAIRVRNVAKATAADPNDSIGF